jgi:hypothetical protein
MRSSSVAVRISIIPAELMHHDPVLLDGVNQPQRHSKSKFQFTGRRSGLRQNMTIFRRLLTLRSGLAPNLLMSFTLLDIRRKYCGGLISKTLKFAADARRVSLLGDFKPMQ